MIKLIATDMDGTLLQSDYTISNEFWQQFDRLQDKGITFVCASGRPYYNLVEFFRGHEDQVYFIAENGAYTTFNGEDIAVNALPKNELYELLDFLATLPDINLVLCGKSCAYVNSLDEAFTHEFKKHFCHHKVVKDFREIEDEILKITICSIPGAEEFALPYLEHLQERYKVTISGFVWVDITLKAGDKGVALRTLQQRLGVSPDETMVIGDYLNDLGMFQVAEHSFAVANAHPQIKKAAKYITTSNDENGVAKAIAKVIS